MAKTGASLNRGNSKQDYETPPDFIHAVETRFGKLRVDLAATAENTKAPTFFSPLQNSLAISWNKFANPQWLNPPFDNIAPWASKCRNQSALGAKILFLTPASVGSNWFRDHVHGHALVLALNGRLTFVGQEDPYPKDCILSCYGWGTGFDVWDWREITMDDPMF